MLFFSLSLNFTMAPSLIETNQPFHSDLIFAKGMVASGVAHRFDLFILTCLRTVFRRATVGRIPLDEWSARRRDLYLTTHNIHNRQTDNIHVPDGIQTHNLSRRAAGELRLKPRGHWERQVCIL